MSCKSAICREVSYTFDITLGPAQLVPGKDDIGCGESPSVEQKKTIEAEIAKKLRELFEDQPARCADPENCVCEFDDPLVKRFTRNIPVQTYSVSNDVDKPVGTCVYKVGASVIVTRTTRPGSCEPTQKAVDRWF